MASYLDCEDKPWVTWHLKKTHLRWPSPSSAGWVRYLRARWDWSSPPPSLRWPACGSRCLSFRSTTLVMTCWPSVWWTSAVGGDKLTELLLDLSLQELHFHRLPVHQQHVSRLRHANELHDAFSVCVGAEGHVLYLQLHIQLQKSQQLVNSHTRNGICLIVKKVLRVQWIRIRVLSRLSSRTGVDVDYYHRRQHICGLHLRSGRPCYPNCDGNLRIHMFFWPLQNQATLPRTAFWLQNKNSSLSSKNFIVILTTESDFSQNLL